MRHDDPIADMIADLPPACPATREAIMEALVWKPYYPQLIEASIDRLLARLAERNSIADVAVTAKEMGNTP